MSRSSLFGDRGCRDPAEGADGSPRAIALSLLLVVGLVGGCRSIPKPKEALPIEKALPKVQKTAPHWSQQAKPWQPKPVLENHAFVVEGDVPQYKIGVGDLLEIHLNAGGLIRKKIETVVRQDGTVLVEGFLIEVRNRTENRAAEAIQRQLAPYYKSLQVAVTVKEYRSRKVVILGALGGGAGGGGAIIPLRGRKTLSEVLAEAGGPHPLADLTRIFVMRQSGERLSVNLFQIYQTPDAPDFVVDDGDVIYLVPRTEEVKAKVYLAGEVRRPGILSLMPNMRLTQAIIAAGGPTEDADLAEVYLLRYDEKKQGVTVYHANLKQALTGDLRHDPYLRANDLVLITREPIANWNAFIRKLMPTFQLLFMPVQGAAQTIVQIRALGGP